MMRFPLLPTILVAAAVATMIGLGVWQLQRMGEKKALIARFHQASKVPPIAWPSVPPAGNELLYRKATGFCTEVMGWRAVAGRSASGETGWSHIAACRTGGLEGPGMQVDMGWSKSSAAPAGWRGGEVSGVIAPDSTYRIRLISARPAPGLQTSAPPSPEATPNNHLMYAIQWFFFALAAAIIYLLALRRRQHREKLPPGGAGPTSPPQ
jgi:cytochrome oxidase assembly protein ShyY1